jgi:hypothetical protein
MKNPTKTVYRKGGKLAKLRMIKESILQALLSDGCE